MEDAENERRSQAMVDGVKPVPYWRMGVTRAELAARVAELERRLAEVERRLR